MLSGCPETDHLNPEPHDKRRAQRRRHSACQDGLVLAVVLVCLLLMTGMLVSVCLMYRKERMTRRHTQTQRQTNQTCEPCRQQDAGKTKKTRCCVYNGKHLEHLIDTEVARQVQEEKNGNGQEAHIKREDSLDFVTSKKVSAHLVGSPIQHSDDTDPSIKRPRIYKWNTAHHHSFLRNGIDYRHGRLLVPAAGTYYLYSQVQFSRSHADHPPPRSRDKSANQTHLRPVSFIHQICRFNILYPNSLEDKLLESSNSELCGERGRETLLSSYVGAAVRLRTGDELFVKVQGDQETTRLPSANFFGTYQL